MLTSYAQNFEDIMLWRALRDVRAGAYVDIGAQDPEIDSVSLFFYEKGWRGVHVEPTPAYALKLRARRPDEVVREAVVSTRAGSIDFYEFPDTGLSTGVGAVAQRHLAAGFKGEKIEIPCVTLADVLGEVKADAIHWLKIDTEGMERDVLQSWGDCAVRPWIVLIESTAPMSATPIFAEWEPLLLERGYVFAYFDGLNRFYVHEAHRDLLPAFAAPPNVFDAFQISDRPHAPFGRAHSHGPECGQLADATAAFAQSSAAFTTALDEVRALAYERQLNVERLSTKLYKATTELDVTRTERDSARIDAERTLKEAEAARAETAAARAEGDAFHRRAIDAAEEAARHVRDLRIAEDTLAQREIEALQARGQIAILRLETDALRTQIAEMKASTSWRLTAPVRKLRTATRVLRSNPSLFVPLAVRALRRIAGASPVEAAATPAPLAAFPVPVEEAHDTPPPPLLPKARQIYADLTFAQRNA